MCDGTGTRFLYLFQHPAPTVSERVAVGAFAALGEFPFGIISIGHRGKGGVFRHQGAVGQLVAVAGDGVGGRPFGGGDHRLPIADLIISIGDRLIPVIRGCQSAYTVISESKGFA